jgi:hypothetical protein
MSHPIPVHVDQIVFLYGSYCATPIAYSFLFYRFVLQKKSKDEPVIFLSNFTIFGVIFFSSPYLQNFYILIILMFYYFELYVCSLRYDR